MEYGEKYYLGLDMGTSSVGWAVTDENYRLRRAKGKDLWGSRLFDEANSSVERRSHRTGRRRAQREKARIGLLTEYFADEISKVDPGFLIRLQESKYHFEDRCEENQQKYALFHDKNYTDADYYAEYPTIFHLRKELIENPREHDVRLVYLALLNMFKHRGNFLTSTLDTETDADADMASAWGEFSTTAELFGIVFGENVDVNKIEGILGEKGLSRTQICERLCEYLEVKRADKQRYELLQLITGKTAKLVNIFNVDGNAVIDEDNKNFSLCFRDASFEEKSLQAMELLGDEYYSIISAAKQVHDIGLLANITKGHQYLTQARVEAYQQHQSDLALLKKVLKKYDMEAYNKMFRIMDVGNYSAYVGSVNSHDKKIRRNGGKGRSAEDLFKTIKGHLKNYPQDDPDVKTILERIESESFLPKQLTSANGVIPNQVYVKEMKAILGNAENYLPFLLEKDESGYTVSERILKLFSFRIPYYVGPIGQKYVDEPGYNVWAVRKRGQESGRVLPWNFEDKIDTKRTAEKFIERMVRHCSYLGEERALPKASLLYEKFMVLNELNNLKVFGEAISVEQKQGIYQDLFLKGKKVSIRNIEAYFKKNGFIASEEKDFLSGIDVEGGFKASLSSLGKFRGVLGEEALLESNREMIEDIIFWGTIFGDDKKFVKECIEEKYGEKLSQDQIKKILGFKFSGWGNLSREFLEMEGKSEDGTSRSIILAMWETNDNLMKLLSDKYTYKKTLETKVNRMNRPLSEWTPEDLEGMYLSAPVKRMVWQTLKIIHELVEIIGHTPDRVFVEMAREDGEKGKRTSSRKKRLMDLYSAIGAEGREWKSEIDQLTDADLRQKKLYLYYLQMGRCMYSGEEIDLHTLLTDNNAYDIDHIYPQHFIKDDSIENNLVLVKKQKNAAKSDTYPLSTDVRSKMYGFWKMLEEKGFITKEKYSRLIRTTPFSEEEKASFISRQLVETRQGTKAITQILKQALPGTTIVFSKAGEVSAFRNEYDIVKVRSINELHHAKDAYLNIVVGNAYFAKFTSDPLNFIRQASKRPNEARYKYNMKNIFLYDIMDGEKVAWVGTKDNPSSSTLDLVKHTMQKNSVLITKRTYIEHGGFTREDTIYPVKKANEQGYIAVSADPRLSDVTKYGGRTSISTQCYCLAEYKVKGKRIRSLEALPIYLGNIEELSIARIAEYLEGALALEYPNKPVSDVTVLIPCIRFSSMVKIDGFYYYLGGKTGGQIYLQNAEPLFLSEQMCLYVKKIEKARGKGFYGEMDKNGKEIISKQRNQMLYMELCRKISEGKYRDKKTTIGSILQNGYSKFEDLELESQVEVLLQIILWCGIPYVGVDLSKIGGSNISGKCRMSKKITDCQEVKLIYTSTTGLITRTVDLLTL